MKQKCNVVMLPSEKESSLIKYGKYLSDNINSWYKITEGEGKSQHLYIITSSEIIQDGDWVYDPTTGHINPIKEGIYSLENARVQGAFKIIAATDKSLTIDKRMSKSQSVGKYTLLPEPSPDFIQHFISEYNKGNIITEVMVEYDKLRPLSKDNHYIGDELQLKVDKYNQITIITTTKAKELWNKDEVKSFGRYILQISNNVIKKNTKMTPLDKENGENLLNDLFDDWNAKNL